MILMLYMNLPHISCYSIMSLGYNLFQPLLILLCSDSRYDQGLLYSSNKFYQGHPCIVCTCFSLQQSISHSKRCLLSYLQIIDIQFILRHGAFVQYGHRRVPVTLASVAERLAVQLLQPVLTTQICRGWDSNTQPSACQATTNDCTTAAVRQQV